MAGSWGGYLIAFTVWLVEIQPVWNFFFFFSQDEMQQCNPQPNPWQGPSTETLVLFFFPFFLLDGSLWEQDPGGWLE
jgi:hypothetical protein